MRDVGRLEATGDRWCPYRLLDDAGGVVDPVMLFLADLQAADSPATTLRSYGMDLLRWWRFLDAVQVEWDRATRAEARDFARWMQVADKPVRVHWRRREREAGLAPDGQAAAPVARGAVNAVTGKAAPGAKYAPSTRAHCETVVRTFYEFHRERGTGPIINPFPLRTSRAGQRAHAHHNPMDPFTAQRTGRYRPTLPARVPRRIPDAMFDKIFAGLRSHRDRALLAFWISTGARAEELLGARQHHAVPGQQLIVVARKGTGQIQHLPASPDAFVWLRLYQEEIWSKGAARGGDEPLWFTLRRPWRALTYPAARAMFQRANHLLGANWTLHDLRHSAAYRLTQDPQMPLTHVQWVLGHRRLTTTQLYLNLGRDEVVESVLAHHARKAEARGKPTSPVPAPGYDPASLQNLFGRPV